MDRVFFSFPGGCGGVWVSPQLLDKIRLFTPFLVVLFVYFLLIIQTPTQSLTPLSPPLCVKWWVNEKKNIYNKLRKGKYSL